MRNSEGRSDPRRFADWDFVEEVKCGRCKWFSGYRTGKPRCAAFPLGIPDEIWWGRVDHEQPFPGDRGYRFEPKG